MPNPFILRSKPFEASRGLKNKTLMSEQQEASNEALVDLEPRKKEYFSPSRCIPSATLRTLWEFSMLDHY